MIAPNADVVLRGDYKGELYGKGLVVDPWQVLRCAPLARNTQPIPSCSDGMLNGSETGIDCGGTCQQCSPGNACYLDTECISALASPTAASAHQPRTRDADDKSAVHSP